MNSYTPLHPVWSHYETRMCIIAARASNAARLGTVGLSLV